MSFDFDWIFADPHASSYLNSSNLLLSCFIVCLILVFLSSSAFRPEVFHQSLLLLAACAPIACANPDRGGGFCLFHLRAVVSSTSFTLLVAVLLAVLALVEAPPAHAPRSHATPRAQVPCCALGSDRPGPRLPAPRRFHRGARAALLANCSERNGRNTASME
jgi:hypothetical protein